MTPRKARRELDALIKDRHNADVMAIVEELSDPEMLAAALDHPDPFVQYGLARNLHPNASLLYQLADSPDWGVRIEVAQNWNAPRALTMEMARVEDDPRVLAALADTCRVSTQLAVAANERTDEETLRRLAEEHILVRIAAMAHPSMPEDVLAEAAADRDGAVREAAASNPSLPAEVVEKLARDPEQAVRDALVAAHGNRAARAVVAAVGTAIAAVSDVDRWSEALRNSAVEGVKGLRAGLHSADEAYMARDGVTVAGLLVHLAAGFDEAVEVIGARATEAYRARAAGRTAAASGIETEKQAEQALFEQHPATMAQVAYEEARDPNTAPARLEELSRSGVARVRSGVAMNPATPPALRAELAGDPDRYVAAAAATTARVAEERAARAALETSEAHQRDDHRYDPDELSR